MEKFRWGYGGEMLDSSMRLSAVANARSYRTGLRTLDLEPRMHITALRMSAKEIRQRIHDMVLE